MKKIRVDIPKELVEFAKEYIAKYQNRTTDFVSGSYSVSEILRIKQKEQEDDK